MRGPISAAFVSEHRALARLLARSLLPTGEVDVKRFDTFRRRLLRHIAAEEKVLLPALERKLGRPPLCRDSLRREHAGLAAMCVLTPDGAWLVELQGLLAHHHRVEESRDGFFALCDAHLADEAPALRKACAALPPLTLASLQPGRGVRQQLAEVLQETGLSPGAAP
jgi:hypothetical protein